MPKNSRQLIAEVSDIRLGEGYSVDLHVVPSKSIAGAHHAGYAANISSVPAPDKKYSADTAFVLYDRQTIHFLFGQTSLRNQEHLRTLLVVKMTPAWAARFLQTLAEGGDQSFSSITNKAALPREEIQKFDLEEPKETIALNANIVLTAISGGEGCLDFYHASPFSMSQTAKTRKLGLDPVVRVCVRGSLLLGMFDELSKIMGALPLEAKIDSFAEISE